MLNYLLIKAFSCKVKTYFFIVSILLGSLSLTFSWIGSKVPSDGSWYDPYRADHLFFGIAFLFSVISFIINVMKFAWFKEKSQLTWLSAANIIRSMFFTIALNVYHLIYHLDAYLFPVIVVGIVLIVLHVQNNQLSNIKKKMTRAA